MLSERTDTGVYNAAAELIDAAVARGYGDKVAFCDGARSLTYGQLREQTWRMAAAFAALGLKPENRVALLLPDCVDFPVAFWGAVRAGSASPAETHRRSRSEPMHADNAGCASKAA